jgi:hypothetical protein
VSDGRLPVAEDPFGRGSIQPFGERRQHYCDLVRGGLQTIQGRVAPGSESRVAGRASKRLDALGMAMRAIPNQGVDMSFGDPGVPALLVGTGEALGVHLLGRSPTVFHLTPRSHRRRHRPHDRRVGAGEVTGGAVKWGAWLEKTLERDTPGCCCRLDRTMMGPTKGTKPREREHEDKQEQEQEHMKSHKNPRHLKLGEGKLLYKEE